MTVYWCEAAWLGGSTTTTSVEVTLDGDRITAVHTGVGAPSPESVRLEGLTLPGIANGHSHAFHRALRGRTHTGTGSFWTWRDQMYGVVERLDPDRYLALARATFAEMVLAGYTTVGEFHYVHHGAGGVPYADPNAMGRAVIEAARQAGLRITLLDTCYLHGGIDTPLNDGQRRFADGSADRWSERVSELADGPGVRIGAAVHSVRAVQPAEMEVVVGWVTARRAPLHAHVSEQPAENDACLAQWGRTPTEVLADAGVLAAPGGFTAVHATHLHDHDIALLGEHGCTCCFCPTTERDLADGIGPSVPLRAAGVRLSVGSDSNAFIDPFEELRAIELDERLGSGLRGNHAVAQLLADGCRSGHASLGWPDAGTIEVGALADLVTVSLDSVRLAGTPTADALAAVLFAAAPADVRHVVIGGDVVVRDGAHVRLDVVGELRRALSSD